MKRQRSKRKRWKATVGLGIATLLVAGAAAADLRRAGEPYEVELPAFKDNDASGATNSYPFWADVSNVPQSFERTCVPGGGDIAFLRILRLEHEGEQFAALAGRPEVLFDSCPVSELPGHITGIRLESLCEEEPVVLTRFDGTTIDIPFQFQQIPILVGQDIIVPAGCDRVAQRLVLEVSPPGPESIQASLSP